MNENIKVRELNTEDIFTLIDISNAMNTSEIIDKIMDLSKDEKSKDDKDKILSDKEIKEIQLKVGLKAVFIILQNLGNAKQQFYKLLSDISEVPVGEIKKQSLKDTVSIIIQIVNQEGFKDFFSDLTNKVA